MVNRIKKIGRHTGQIKATAQTLLGKKLIGDVNRQMRSQVQSYAVGGTVKRTGLAKVHKGELVITAAAHKVLRKIMKK